MKFRLRFLPFFLLAACGTLTPAQQTTLSDDETAGQDAGIGYLTGGPAGAIAAAAPSAPALVNDAALAIRELEGTTAANAGTAPSASTISTIITAVTSNPTVAKAITAPVAKSIAAAVASGATPSSATEAAAVGLDSAAAVTPTTASTSAEKKELIARTEAVRKRLITERRSERHDLRLDKIALREMDVIARDRIFMLPQ
jgi:hypothetical protein